MKTRHVGIGVLLGDDMNPADMVLFDPEEEWVVDPARAVPADLWKAEVEVPEGLARTAAWYRAEGWL